MLRASLLRSAAVASLVLAVAACGSDSSTKTTASRPPSTMTTRLHPSSLTTDAPFRGGATTPTSQPAQGGPKALLTAVRASAHTGYDRLVFEFEAATPGYAVQYVAEQFKNADSGAVIAVNGGALAQVKLARAATSDISGTGTRETYTGPKRFTPAGTAAITEVVLISDSEGTVTWAVGLKQQAPFSVETLDGPSRVVVDFQS